MKIIPQEALPEKGIRYSRAQLYRREKEGTFPKRIHLGLNRIGYVESEINAWIETLIAKRDGKAA